MIKLETPYMVHVSESVCEDWANEALEYFKENPEETIYYITSGDALVFATNYSGWVCIYDCTINRSASINLKYIVNDVSNDSNIDE